MNKDIRIAVAAFIIAVFTACGSSTAVDRYRHISGIGATVVFSQGDPFYSARIQPFTIMVSYARSFSEMVKAGRFNWININLRSGVFRIEGTGDASVSVEVVHFGKTLSTWEARNALALNGFRTAKIEELFAFAEQYPDEQRKYPIAALGSGWIGPFEHESAPVLDEDNGLRCVRLIWVGDTWPPETRFLAVRVLE